MPDVESVAKLLLINEKGEILVLRRSEYLAHPEKSHMPDLPGGIVDPGESERTAVVRELKEEAGIIIDDDDVKLGYARTYFYENERKSVSKLLYVAHVDYTPDVVVSWEHEAFVWWNKDELQEKYPLREFYAEGLKYLLDHKFI